MIYTRCRLEELKQSRQIDVTNLKKSVSGLAKESETLNFFYEEAKRRAGVIKVSDSALQHLRLREDFQEALEALGRRVILLEQITSPKRIVVENPQILGLNWTKVDELSTF